MGEALPNDRPFSIPDARRLVAVFIYGGMATLFFTTIYGYTNYRASQLRDHLAMYADWEQAIPLVDWMVIPYLSLNLLLLAVVFVLREVRLIRQFCFSLCVGAVIAGLIFYFFPGELGFARAVGEGHLAIFDQIYAIDYPHNLFPSLHVTYSTLAVWAMQLQVPNRSFRFFLWAWLVLICASVVFTHQHHVFDVLTGGMLAAALIPFFFREKSRG